MKSQFEYDLLQDAIEKGYVVFAPKGKKDLRTQYPELATFDEFKDRNKISENDMLFIWFFRCSCSPYADQEDKEKLEACINVSDPGEVTRNERKQRWANLKFSGPMNAALERMQSINTAARIRRYQACLHTMETCLQVIGEQPPSDLKNRGLYLNQLAGAHELLNQVTSQLEQGSFGVEEINNTAVVDALRGVLSAFRTRQQA